MRPITGFLCAAALVCAAFPARAESPIALQVMGGFGPGAYAGNGSLAGLVSADLAWRDRPGRAWLLTYDWGGLLPTASKVLYAGTRAGMSSDHQALLIGIGRQPARAAASTLLQGGVGVGQIRSGIRSSVGLALGACVGLRLMPPPSSIGFLIALRHSHVSSGIGSENVMAAVLGIVLRPQ